MNEEIERKLTNIRLDALEKKLDILLRLCMENESMAIQIQIAEEMMKVDREEIKE